MCTDSYKFKLVFIFRLSAAFWKSMKIHNRPFSFLEVWNCAFQSNVMIFNTRTILIFCFAYFNLCRESHVDFMSFVFTISKIFEIEKTHNFTRFWLRLVFRERRVEKSNIKFKFSLNFLEAIVCSCLLGTLFQSQHMKIEWNNVIKFTERRITIYCKLNWESGVPCRAYYMCYKLFCLNFPKNARLWW